MKNIEEDNGKDSSQKSDIAESNEAQSTAPQKSSSEPDGGAEEAEMGNDHPSKTPSSVGEIEPVGRTTSNSVSTRTLLETAGQTLSGPEAELVLNPLRLAFETKNTKVVELALDCLHKLVEYNHLEGDPGLDGGKDAQLFADILNMVCRTVDNSSPDRGSSGNEKNKSWKRKKNDDETEMERPPQQQPSQKKNKKEIAIFGNYRNYYGYRVGSDLDEDPRLKMMKREWFEGKDCLDIGCNSGLVTISIAKKFGCHSILGVDIDGARIEDANWTLRKIIRTNTPKITSKNPRAATAELFNGSEKSTIKSPDDETGDSPPSLEKDLLKIVSFEKGNFVQNWHPPPKKHYHAILCLSVSKWIHLNWGDDGVITLFSRVWALLQPGGVFVLEPQDWTSYYKNRLVSETTAANYKNIKIPPEDFQDVLLDKIGFRRVENITSGLSSGTKSGFARPILAFWK